MPNKLSLGAQMGVIMKNDKILRAIGNIDEDLIDRAAPTDCVCQKDKSVLIKFVLRFKGFAPVAACLIIAAAIAVPTLLNQQHPSPGNSGSSRTDSTPGTVTTSPPSLSLDNSTLSVACYIAPEDWRGLPTENYVLDEHTNGIATDRMVFTTLDDLAAYADAFVLVPNIHETAQDNDLMQTSIAEYAETIGDRLNTRQWDNRTISTGSRVLIRQHLMSGCTMEEPNNLLRKGGVYLLPLKFNPDWSAYEVVGDLDVLFELDDTGEIVSHSIREGFSKYDGKSLTELLDDVRALYPAIDAEFIEQPISTAEQAKNQVITAYYASGYRKFSVEYDSETIIKGADAYLFKISFDGYNSEYAAIAKENGAFIRGEIDWGGNFRILGGLGGFP